MNGKSLVPDYGWRDGSAMASQAYLSKPIVTILNRLRARKVLDLGCGNGAFAHWLQAQGFEVVACDADIQGIQIGASRDSGVVFKHVGIYEPPEKLNCSGFDAVYATEVIEHLFAPAALPRFARSVLKPGGHLIVTTPYHGYLKNVLIALTGKWDYHHTALWEGGHIKFWSRRTLSTLLHDSGFEVVDFMGAGRICGLWKSMIVVARLRTSVSRRNDGTEI